MHRAEDYSINDRIANRMDALGMSKAKLAKLTGISAATITRYLQHKISPSGSVIVLLAEALWMTPNELLGWDDAMTESIRQREKIVDQIQELQEELRRLERMAHIEL